MAGRGLILDFGGVISRTLFETHAETERALGLAAGSLTWRGPFAPEGDPLWRAMQAGEISERDYWRTRTVEVAALVGAEWTEMADFVRAARGADPAAMVRPEAVAAVERARAAGCRLAILSNELDLFYGADLRAQLPLLEAFDVIVHLQQHPEARLACLPGLPGPAGPGRRRLRLRR
jgi:putative hydrolase of the HAD superfamily